MSGTGAGESDGDAPRETARACLRRGIAAVDPYRAVRTALSVVETADGPVLRLDAGSGPGPGTATGATREWHLASHDRVVAVGAGKAADRLVAGVGEVLAAADRGFDGGVVVTDDRDPAGDGPPAATLDVSVPEVQVPESVTVHEAGHPVPDQRGAAAAETVEGVADAADRETLVVAALTGGGSALLPAPAGDLTLSDLRALTDALLASGEAIGPMNAVRRHCSRLKGGRLARRVTPATLAGLVVSDVVGDDPSVVASGPTVPDPTTYADALAVADRTGVERTAPAVVAHLRAGVGGDHPETPDVDDPCFDRARTTVVANGRRALRAAAAAARDRGVRTRTLSPAVAGEASSVGRSWAGVLGSVAAGTDPGDAPVAVLAAGETTVTLAGAGETADESDGTDDPDPEGGPNAEVGLAAALSLRADTGDAACLLAAVDTDGRDGPPTDGPDPAGALVDATTVPDPPTDADDERARARRALAAHDAAGYLRERDALVVTGPTGTNVADLHVGLVVPAPGSAGDGDR